jgi:hypothetical protein
MFDSPRDYIIIWIRTTAKEGTVEVVELRNGPIVGQHPQGAGPVEEGGYPWGMHRGKVSANS